MRRQPVNPYQLSVGGALASESLQGRCSPVWQTGLAQALKEVFALCTSAEGPVKPFVGRRQCRGAPKKLGKRGVCSPSVSEVPMRRS
jgi:hypothetical protein